MKRKLICGLMSAMMILSLAGCGEENNDKTDFSSIKEIDYSQYMTLSDYKSIRADVDERELEVTEEEVKEYVEYYRSQKMNTENIESGVTADGDKINLDFSGLLDGVAFASGTATDTEYTIGGNFISDLDRGLIGLEVGKEYDIPCRFPDDYGNEELNGKDVIFRVTVNYIINETLPDYNDEFVKEFTKDSDKPCNTMAEFEQSIKEQLAETKLYEYNNEAYAQFMVTVVEQAEIKGQPEDEMASAKAMIRSNAESEFEAYSSYYGANTFEEYIKSVYQYEDMDAFEADIEQYAKDYINEKMAIELMAKAEGVTVSEEDYTEYLDLLLAQTGYETAQEFKAAYGDSFESDVRFEVLYNKMFDIIVGYATAK